eukprot:675811-Amphidinium_carterae.1
MRHNPPRVHSKGCTALPCYNSYTMAIQCYAMRGSSAPSVPRRWLEETAKPCTDQRSADSNAWGDLGLWSTQLCRSMSKHVKKLISRLSSPV